MATNDLTTFICLFHSPDRAEEALSALENAGLNRAAMTSTWKGSESGNADYSAELTRIGVPERDLRRLEDGIEDGGVVISLEAPESRSDDIEAIFHKYSAGKIDETDINRSNIAEEPFVAPLAGMAAMEATRVADSAVVPVAEEDLLVGKREVDRGGVRVFSRVIEEPVSEELQLHEEHVVIDRRPVNRAVTEGDLASAGQTIELTETEEVPVVSKVSRVVEEVRVGVVGSEHTETVQDTVRHTEVDVEPLSESTTGDVTRSTFNGSNKSDL